jgi:hypothetical protein
MQTVHRNDAAVQPIRRRRDNTKGPAWTWPAWTDADTWELNPDVEPEDNRDHAVAFTPSRHDELYWLGYELGLNRENASISSIAASNAANSNDLAELGWFHSGFLAGKAEWDARLDEMCGSEDFAEFSARVTDREMYPYGGLS